MSHGRRWRRSCPSLRSFGACGGDDSVQPADGGIVDATLDTRMERDAADGSPYVTDTSPSDAVVDATHADAGANDAARADAADAALDASDAADAGGDGSCLRVACGPSDASVPDAQPFDFCSDPQNCGTCANACSAPQVCCSGGCGPFASTLAPSQQDAHGIAAYAGVVYWTQDLGGSTGSVMMVPRSGGVPKALAPSQNSPQAIAVDASGAYWLNLNISGMPGALMTVPLAGGSPTPLVSGITTDSRYLAIDAQYVYWTGTSGGFTFDANVQRVPKGGGSPSIVATEKGTAGTTEIVTDGSFAYYFVYLPGSSAAQLRMAPADGSAPSTLLASLTTPSGLALHTGVLYWKDCSPNCFLYALPVSGGTPRIIALNVTSSASRLAVDDRYVYWTDWGQNTIHKVLATGGCAILLSSAESCPDGIALDDSFVYWANFGCSGSNVRQGCK